MGSWKQSVAYLSLHVSYRQYKNKGQLWEVVQYIYMEMDGWMEKFHVNFIFLCAVQFNNLVFSLF